MAECWLVADRATETQRSQSVRDQHLACLLRVPSNKPGAPHAGFGYDSFAEPSPSPPGGVCNRSELFATGLRYWTVASIWYGWVLGGNYFAPIRIKCAPVVRPGKRKFPRTHECSVFDCDEGGPALRTGGALWLLRAGGKRRTGSGYADSRGSDGKL